MGSGRAGSVRRPASRREPRAVDLFAGCGGLTEGLRQAGFRVVGAIEMDELAVECYRLNHPRVRTWTSDIRRVTTAEVLRALGLRRGELELLAGCPPCQGFSSIRTKNGGRCVRDERNGLVSEFLRFVRGLRPRTIMFENVPGLVGRRHFKRFVGGLKKLGYHVNWSVLDAAEYAVPQRRRRLILLAGNAIAIGFGRRARTKRTTRDAIGALAHPRRSRDPHHKMAGKRSERIRHLIALIPKNGGSRTDLASRYWLDCHKKRDGFRDVYGRMRWSEVAPTITAGCVNPSKGRFLHPMHNRAITVREAALLQSFPKSYKFPTGKGAYPVAELVGNALPPEFVRRHAVGIRRILVRQQHHSH